MEAGLGADTGVPTAGRDSAGFPGGNLLAIVLSFMSLRDVPARRGAWRVSVRELRLINANVTDAGLAYLKCLPLQTLYLSGCKALTDAGLAHLKCLPLHTLDLSNCSALTDAGLAHLKCLPLYTLILSNCKAVTDAGLAHLTCLQLHTCLLYTSDAADE